jgi:formamidopyrimidine-DNA glycosylase
MEQRFFSGVGNYIKCEVLYIAMVKPDRILSNLTDIEIETIRQSIFWVIDTSLSCNGLTISDFITPNQDKGTYDPLVYGKDKDRADRDIVKATFSDKRTSHYVPGYQT